MALQMTWHPSLHRRKSGPPLGLRNLGNSCYLNSVLQCLTYTPPLANFCLRSQHSNICQKLDANRKRENCPFCVLEKRIARSLNLDAANDAPSKIGNCLRLYAEHFQWGRQEDAHEFLRYVIDACHNTCLRLLKVSGAAGRAPGRGADGVSGRTIVKEIFGGALLSQVKCLSCGAESNKTDDIMDISLDLYQSNSLKDALRRFFQPEVLDGDNKYKCESCKKLSAARKQMFIHQAPNVLVIQLKRFEGINGGKINKDIAFEEVLFLNSFMLKPSKDPQNEYSLFGSIVHSGYSPESGHYYAYVKDPTGQWYCCNDAHVSLSTTQDVLSEKVYILFYLRSTPKKFVPLKNGFRNCEMKFADANGKNVLKTQKFSVVKSPPMTNGTVSPGRVISTSLKSSEVVATQHTQFDNLRKHENKTASVNGIGHMTVKDTLEGEATNGYERASVSEMGKTSSMGVLSDISSNGSYQTTTTLNGLLNHGNSNQADNFPSVSENGKVKFSLVRNRHNNHNKVGNLQKHGNGISPSMVNGSHGQNAVRECDNVVGKKRKSVNTGSSDGGQIKNADCGNSSSQDGQSDRHNILEYNQPPGSLEKLKERLAQETSSDLRSCCWYTEVEDFMHAQKRICSKEVTKSPNNVKLSLIAEAKKIFISRLPEELKGRLVGELKSFIEKKVLS